MALKFLNKKGWHTGSLRNIENVWKAEQKHEAEQKKLEELRKQIHEERERAEFRQLQEQAGLIPKQERLDFLYESGLAVGKGSSGFKELESLPKTVPETAASSSSTAKQEQSAVPGALFEEKTQSANDAWRKLHSDPLLMIRQREQEALARVKNNPIQMAMIRKSVEAQKSKGRDEKKRKKKHKKKSKNHSSAEDDSDFEDATLKAAKQREDHHKRSKSDKLLQKSSHTPDESNEKGAQRKSYYEKEHQVSRHGGAPDSSFDRRDDREGSRKSDHGSWYKKYSSDQESNEKGARRRSYYDKPEVPRLGGAPDPRFDRRDDHDGSKKIDHHSQQQYSSDEESNEKGARRKSYYDKEHEVPRHGGAPDSRYGRSDNREESKKGDNRLPQRQYSSDRHTESRHEKRNRYSPSGKPPRNEVNNRHRGTVKLSEEERAAKLREMQMDAELHEEQRWKRLKKAADSDAQESLRDNASMGRNFLDAAQKSVYGAEKGGSSTIEESVRRRTHYSQGRSAAETNAFRRM